MLLGLSIQKIFMPSVANTLEQIWLTIKLLKRINLLESVTSRNGNKIPVALLKEFDEAIVSQAYTVFEIIDEQ